MLRTPHWLALYAVICLSVSSMWLALNLSSPLWPGLMLFLLLPWPLTGEMGWPHFVRRPRLDYRALALGLAAMAPVIAVFALTYAEEFPFAGDHDHHWLMAQALLEAVHFYLFAVVAIVAVLIYFRKKAAWLGMLWLLGAWWLSTHFPPLEFVVRYPAGFYFLAAPLNWLLSGATDPLFANRLVNVLALPAYLFLLRPWLVGRWPDWRAALWIGLFFWQKDWIYYFTTTYLEPWSLVCVLLSIELAISSDERQIELAPALAGLGCMFKEQAVFALAFAAARFAWHKRKTWGPIRASLTGGFFFLPFFTYYSARGHSGVFRKVDPGNWSDLLNLNTWEEYALHQHASLQWGGELALALLLAALVNFAIRAKRSERIWLTLSVALVAVSELLYLLDKQSAEYLGYPRFHLLTWPLLVAPILAQADRRWVKGVCIVAGAANLLVAAPMLRLMKQPDYERNFIEQYYAPIYFPLRQLLHEVPGDGKPRQLLINQPVQFASFSYSLGRVMARELASFTQSSLTPSLVCTCSEAKQTLLMVDLLRPSGHAIVDVPSNLAPQDLRGCVQQMRRSCRKVVTVESSDGRTIGALGFTP